MEIALVDRTAGVPKEVLESVPTKLETLHRHDHCLEKAEVKFIEHNNPRIEKKEQCNITVYGRGHVIRATAYGSDAMSALDIGINKLVHAVEKTFKPIDKTIRKAIHKRT
jgi:ribosomal subunit interface protein